MPAVAMKHAQVTVDFEQHVSVLVELAFKKKRLSLE